MMHCKAVFIFYADLLTMSARQTKCCEYIFVFTLDFLLSAFPLTAIIGFLQLVRDFCDAMAERE